MKPFTLEAVKFIRIMLKNHKLSLMIKKYGLFGTKIGNQKYCPKMAKRHFSFKKYFNFVIELLMILKVYGSLSLILIVLFSSDIYSQSGSGFCEDHVPFYIIDLSYHPEADTIIHDIGRDGACCNGNRCVEFIVFLHPETTGIEVEIVVGSEPAGSMNWSVNCGPPQSVDNLVCLEGENPQYLSYCKPGSDLQSYSFGAVAEPGVDNIGHSKPECPATINTYGLTTSSITIESTESGPGLKEIYESYVTVSGDSIIAICDSDCPDFAEYVVCGDVDGSECVGISHFCDTIIVFFYDNIGIELNPSHTTFCDYEEGINLTTEILAGIPPYSFE